MDSPSSSKLTFLVVVVVAALALSACSSSRLGRSPSWLVKPHQREYLADRIMRVDADAQERAADQHIITTREGAIGGYGTAGGGCGCN